MVRGGGQRGGPCHLLCLSSSFSLFVSCSPPPLCSAAPLSDTAYFGFPIELCAEYKGDEQAQDPRMPIIYLQVNSLDGWQRRRVEVCWSAARRRDGPGAWSPCAALTEDTFPCLGLCSCEHPLGFGRAQLEAENVAANGGDAQRNAVRHEWEAPVISSRRCIWSTPLPLALHPCPCCSGASLSAVRRSWTTTPTPGSPRSTRAAF